MNETQDVPVRREMREASQGQIIVLFAMFSIVMVGMLGLATDLGMAFAQRRTIQNAADAAALAGARQVVKYKDTAPTSAYTEANTFATASANRLSSAQSMTVCRYIDDTFKEPPDPMLDACTSTVPAAATGVHAEVTEVHDTFFIRVLPGAPETLELTAQATARVERLRNPPKDAPFILCGSSAWAIKDKAGAPIDRSLSIISADGKVISDFVGYTFRVRDQNIGTGSAGGPKDKADCDTPEGWKGMADAGNESATVPGWFKYHTGTQVGVDFTPVQGVGGCIPPNYTGCVMFLPVAINSPTPASQKIWVVGFAPFYVTCVGSNCQDTNGLLIDNFITLGPSDPGWSRDDAGSPVVIRMIQ